jgi:hypothetical protein
MLEQTFITSMIKADGAFSGFFARPIAALLGVVTILLWAGMLWHRRTAIGRAAAAP